MSMQKFSQTLAASASLRINISGEYFRLGSTYYAITVRFYKGSSVTNEMLLIDGGTWARIEGGFDGFELINSSSGAQSLDVFIGSGEIGIDRIIGEVSVINGEISRVKSKTCFSGQSSITSLAGEYPAVELFNPAASGVNLVLNLVTAYCQYLGVMGLTRTVVQLATLVGSGSNKFIGQADSLGKIRRESNAVVAAGTVFSVASLGVAYDSREFVFSEPVLIPPGNGVYVYANSINSALGVSFQWIEEAI